MATSAGRTFYDVLGLNRTASRIDIKDAYKKMALRYHPDKNPGDTTAVAVFQEIVEAFETLHDIGKRAQYNVKIGVTGPAPERKFRCGSYWRAANPPNYTPPSERPSSFWEEEFSAFPTQAKSHTSSQSKYNERAEEVRSEEAKRGAEKRRRGVRREERKKTLVVEMSQNLAVALSTILQLETAIQTAEADQKFADDFMDREDIFIGEDDPLWETIYARNIRLNSLRKEHTKTIGEYKKLYRSLKKLNHEKGEEAREIYKALKKHNQEEKTFETDESELRAHAQVPIQESHHQSAPTHQENQNPNYGDSESGFDGINESIRLFSPFEESFSLPQVQEDLTNNVRPHQNGTHIPARAAPDYDPFSHLKDTFISSLSFDGSADDQGLSSPTPHINNKYSSADMHGLPSTTNYNDHLTETKPNDDVDGSTDKKGLPSTTNGNYQHSEAALDEEDDDSTSTQGLPSTSYEDHPHMPDDRDDDDPTDEEVILFEVRKIHATHKELQAEFWDISPEDDTCCYCGAICTVMMCPEWEVCGLKACEYCKNEH